MEQEFSTELPSNDPKIDLLSLIEHRESIDADEQLQDVYRYFEQHGNKFVGVIEDGKLLGIASQAKIGFLLGSRYGFPVFGKKPIRLHMLDRHVRIRLHTPLLAVLDEAFSRNGDDFHDDVALVDDEDRYYGMVPMQRLVRLQSQLISEKTRLAEEQQRVLAAKNQQLFSSLHQLRQSQGRYDILFENSALGVALLSPSGEIETCNRRAELLLSLDGEEVSHGSLAGLIDADAREEFLFLLQHHEKKNGDGSSHQHEFKLRLAGRGVRLFKFFTSWIKETGQVCVLLDDITEQRRLELKAAQEDRSVTVDTLAGGIAHEINNKLVPVVGFSELLLADARRLGSSQETVQYCNIIHECALESSKIIGQLLQISRPPAAEKQVCDLRELARQVVAILRFQIRESEAEVAFQLPQEESLIQADPGQIKQVIINLLINSLQAVGNCARRRVLVSVALSPQTVALTVEDTGHGIRPEHLKRVFDPFFTTKTFHRGTGLGLSICASIVRQHGGDIQIDSTVGVGTAIKVQLPAASLNAPRSSREKSGKHGKETLSAGSVLVVDDEEYVACAVQESLRARMTCNVERVMNGQQAIERLLRHEFHLIISDVRMPGLDGFELYQWVEKNTPALANHFLFITGDAGSADLHERLNRLGVPVLRKPFSLDALFQASRRLVKTEGKLATA